MNNFLIHYLKRNNMNNFYITFVLFLLPLALLCDHQDNSFYINTHCSVVDASILTPIDSALIQMDYCDQTYEGYTDMGGTTEFKIPSKDSNRYYKLRAIKTGYNTFDTACNYNNKTDSIKINLIRQ